MLIENTINLKGKFIQFENLLIGSGSYGAVHFGLSTHPCRLLGIKGQNLSHYKAYKNEVKILKRVKDSKLFPELISDFKGTYNYYIIQKLGGPSLPKFLIFSGNIDKITILNIAIELFMNIKILHEKGVIHCDMKEDNFIYLLDTYKDKNRDIHFSLIDFGFASIIINKKGNNIIKNYDLGVFYLLYFLEWIQLDKFIVKKKNIFKGS